MFKKDTRYEDLKQYVIGKCGVSGSSILGPKYSIDMCIDSKDRQIERLKADKLDVFKIASDNGIESPERDYLNEADLIKHLCKQAKQKPSDKLKAANKKIAELERTLELKDVYISGLLRSDV